MRKVIITMQSIAPYTQSRMHHTPKLDKETADAYEKRTWREKTTTDEQGRISIPGIAFKMAFDQAAKMLGMQIPGKGKATYTKFFKAGVMVPDPLILPVHKDEAAMLTINANADGVRGSGKRVVRFFPQIREWSGALEAFIIDNTITPEVFEAHAKMAGMMVGVGQYRPESGGNNGRFKCERFVWSEVH